MTIRAQFDGAEREFKINDTSLFEAALGRPAFAVLKDFTSGQWRFDDLAAVLSYALHGPSRELRLAHDMAKQAAKFGLRHTGLFPFAPHPAVIAHLQQVGHGNYAELAVEILTEAVFREVGHGTS